METSSKKSELMEDFDLDLNVDQQQKDKEEEEVIRRPNELNNDNNNNNSRTNTSPLTTILPLVSTVMTMMNTTTSNNPVPSSLNHHPMDNIQEPPSAYIEDITAAEAVEPSSNDKNMLLNEIQEELNELDSSISEKRENQSSISEQMEISA